MKAFASSLRAAFHAVPNEIRVCLELVQTCHQDLQDLISLRNDHLKLLEAAPASILKRLNSVIEQADRSLVAARRIVEKCRPAAHHRDKTPLHRQLEWIWSADSEFRCQEPLLTRHHAAVLAELSFLRQLATWATLEDSSPSKMSQIDAMLLNSGHETSPKISVITSSVSRAWTPSSGHKTPPTTDARIIEYADFPEPVFPDAPAETASNADNVSLASAKQSLTWGTAGRERATSRTAVLSSSHNRDMSLLFKD